MTSVFYLSAICFCFLSFNGLSAQEQSSEKQKTFYIKELNLDKKQEQEFRTINEKFQKDVSNLNIKVKNKAAEKKIKKLEKQRDSDLEKLLGKELFKKYIELRRQERKKLQTLIRKSNRQ